jgi:hypothetical protein
MTLRELCAAQPTLAASSRFLAFGLASDGAVFAGGRFDPEVLALGLALLIRGADQTTGRAAAHDLAAFLQHALAAAVAALEATDGASPLPQ